MVSSHSVNEPKVLQIGSCFTLRIKESNTLTVTTATVESFAASAAAAAAVTAANRGLSHLRDRPSSQFVHYRRRGFMTIRIPPSVQEFFVKFPFTMLIKYCQRYPGVGPCGFLDLATGVRKFDAQKEDDDIIKARERLEFEKRLAKEAGVKFNPNYDQELLEEEENGFGRNDDDNDDYSAAI